MSADQDAGEPGCPKCGAPLRWLGSREVALTEDSDFRRRHTYSCPKGCRGPEADGTFELIECPACGSHDTCATPRADGMEEVACSACGTIVSLAITP